MKRGVLLLMLVTVTADVSLRAQTSAGALFERARASQQSGKLAEAEAAYRDYLRRFGPRAEVLANLGALLARRENYPEAIRYYEQALKADPALTPLHLNLGLAHFKQGQFERAIPEFDRFLKSDPTHRQAMQLRAMALVEGERYVDAEAQYRALLPGDVSVSLGLAMALLRQQKTAEAKSLMEGLLVRGDSAEVELVFGQALLDDGREDEALAAFQRAARLNPQLPRLRLNLGAVYWRQRKTDEAIAAWREELAANPTSFEAQYTLGAALALNEKEQPQAEKLLRQALQQKPRNARVNYQLAKLIWRTRKGPEPATLLERATQADPRFREAFFLYGTVLQAQGNKPAAQKAFARVKELSEQELSRQRDIFLEQE